MSAKHLVVLALVAFVALQANSLPYGTKGGQSYYTQSYSEPLKGSSYVAPQQFAEPSYRQEPVVAAPVVAQTLSAPAQVQSSYQYESAPVKGHYQPEQRYEAPRVQQVQHSESAPVQMSYTQTEPLKSQYVPLVQRQVAAPIQVSSPVQTATFQAPAYQAPSYQAPAYQAPAYQAPAYQAPAKGGEYYQQSFERAPLVAQYESVPVKGSYTPTYSEPLKGSYSAPQSVMPVASAPLQVQTQSVQSEVVAPVAPVKGQSFYQSEQRFESAPVRQVVSSKA